MVCLGTKSLRQVMPLHVIKAWYVQADHSTVVHFASFLPGGFTTMAVINPPESKLAKRTSVQCSVYTIFNL